MKGNFKLDKKGLNHILNGEFDKMGLLTGGGHTKESIKKLEDIMNDHLRALEQVANENNDRLWLNKWLNAFSPNDREVDSMQLQPEKVAWNGVMEFKLKYVSYSGSAGEQIKTVFPES